MTLPRFLAIVSLVSIAVVARFVPHPPNFTPIAAMALFAGARFGSIRVGLCVPLLAMVLSDLFLPHGFHVLTPAVYGSLVLIVGIGTWVASVPSPWAILAASLAGSVSFFVITNLAVWVVFDMYPKTAGGLAACYVAAIPFFRNTVAGDVFFAAILFGGLAGLERIIPAIRARGMPKPQARACVAVR